MTQTLNRMIAAMDTVKGDHSCKYDASLRKKGIDPNVLRGAFYSKCHSVQHIYNYEVVKQYSCMPSRFDDDMPSGNEYDHLLDGSIYTDNDIPYDPPDYYGYGITKMYAITNNPSSFNIIMLVNYNPSNGIFRSVIGNIEDSGWSGCSHDRSDLSWNFSEENDVDFISMYDDYANILKDFIDDVEVGVVALINYIKVNNN